MRNRPKLIEIFGIDGSGMTTLSRSLEKQLSVNGRSVRVLTPLHLLDSFPKIVFSLIQRVPKKKVAFHKRAETFLATYFSFALVQQFLESFSNSGDLIICDRYLNSHFINQGAFGEDITDLQPLFELLPQADLALLIDVPVPVAMSRLVQRGGTKPHENKNYLTKSRKLHLEFAKENNIPILDGTQTPELVMRTAIKLLKEHLKS